MLTDHRAANINHILMQHNLCGKKMHQRSTVNELFPLIIFLDVLQNVSTRGSYKIHKKMTLYTKKLNIIIHINQLKCQLKRFRNLGPYP